MNSEGFAYVDNSALLTLTWNSMPRKISILIQWGGGVGIEGLAS